MKLTYGSHEHSPHRFHALPWVGLGFIDSLGLTLVLGNASRVKDPDSICGGEESPRNLIAFFILGSADLIER